MKQSQTHRLAKALHGEALPWLGMKALYLIIVILLLIPFQLSGAWMAPARAAQKLPVLQLDAAKGKPFQSVLHAVDAAGYIPRTIREEDFLFNVTPATFRYVLVPLGTRIRAESLAMLTRYVAGGGKLVLIPPTGTPDSSVNRLFQLIGLPIAGMTHTDAAYPLYWNGLAQPGSEALPANSAVLLFSANADMTVLARWGADYPAIIATKKGAVLNWQWGRQLSDATNLVALAKVMPLVKPESLILLEHATSVVSAASHASVNHATARPLPETTLIGPDAQLNPKLPMRRSNAILPMQAPARSIFKATSPYIESLALQEAPAKVVQPPTQASPDAKPTTTVSEKSAPEASTPAAPITLKPAPSASSNQVAVPSSKPVKQPVAASQLKPTANVAEKTSNPTHSANPVKQVAKRATKQESAENEVLNNILGIPEELDQPASKPDAPDSNSTQTTATPAEKTQKHFSFLDPEAADVLAPEFDYGVYSMNLRILEDYRRKIQNAIETLHQLAMDVPQAQVDALLQQATTHRKKFESLYLGGKTTAGLTEFAEARRLTLQALALATESPKVEGRAIWLDRGSIIESGNPDGLRKRMQKLRQAGINIVYFETVNAGFPIYPSTLTKSNPMVQGWDPLKVAVEEGHRLGMEVHAWVWCFAVGNRRHNPLINMPADYAGPVLTEDGLMSEALRNHEGGLSVDGRQNEFWLSPASPKARAFLLNLYKEIVTKYDVDGIQLDYIRYPFQTSRTHMGFEAVGRERFHQATGLSLDTMDNAVARMWVAWKTYQVSSFVQQVSSTLKHIKPQLQISAAVFPMQREARIVAIQQDWETWVNNGWVDTLSPMTYTSSPERLQNMFEYVQSSPKRRPLVYPGVALNRLDGGQLVMQLEALRDKGGLGATLFAGSHLNKDKIDTLSIGPYKEHQSLPPHRDVVKSLQTILADYQQKFDTLKRKEQLPNLSPVQAASVQDALTQLSAALGAMEPEQSLSALSASQFTLARQHLNALQEATQAWTTADQDQHALRMQYFAKDVTMLDELLGYLADKATAGVSAAAFKSPGKATPVTATVSTPKPVAAASAPEATTSAVVQETGDSNQMTQSAKTDELLAEPAISN